ncbi:MAG: amidohydrolase family protein, partial [Pseudomonadota bacterium]
MLFDGHSDALRDDVDIVVEDNRIVDVVGGRATVGNATEVAVDGRTVLPGLIDAHVHLFAVHLNAIRTKDYPLTYLTVLALPRIKAMLDRGFTTVRDVAGGDFGIKDALARNLIPGPRAFVGGPGLTQTGGHGDHRRKTEGRIDLCGCANGQDFTLRVVDGPEQMRVAVRDELRKGADHIKVMASGGVGSPHDAIDDCQFSEEELRIAADETALRGSYVAAHTYGSKAVQRAVGNGIRTVEHCNLIDEETARFVRDH